MWVFSTFGMFSIVRDKNDDKRFLVRARKREHLENLIEQVSGIESVEQKILDTPDADYPHRMFLGEEDTESLFEVLFQSIDYSNFKGEVQKTVDKNSQDYLDLLHRVWYEGFRYGVGDVVYEENDGWER